MADVPGGLSGTWAYQHLVSGSRVQRVHHAKLPTPIVLIQTSCTAFFFFFCLRMFFVLKKQTIRPCATYTFYLAVRHTSHASGPMHLDVGLGRDMYTYPRVLGTNANSEHVPAHKQHAA